MGETMAFCQANRGVWGYPEDKQVSVVNAMAAKTIPAHNLKLHDLKTRFNLQETQADDFFTEWLDDAVPLQDADYAVLDRVKRNYLYLLEYPVLESIVKMVVLSPILDLAGFYEPPLRVE